MTFVIDIDDTLIKSEKPGYLRPEEIKSETELVRMLYKSGYIIILHTGRNWDKYKLTINQLKKFGIPFHELVMGKPQGVYIDKDSYKSINDYLCEVEK